MQCDFHVQSFLFQKYPLIFLEGTYNREKKKKSAGNLYLLESIQTC